MILFDFVLVVCLPIDCFSFYSMDVVLNVYADRFGAFLVQQTKTQRSTPSYRVCWKMQKQPGEEIKRIHITHGFTRTFMPRLNASA